MPGQASADNFNYGIFGKYAAPGNIWSPAQLVSSLPVNWTFARSSTAVVADNLGANQTIPANVSAFEGLRLSYDLNDGATMGPELVINGSFTTDTAWNKGAGWSIIGGLGVATACNDGANLYQVILTPNRFYTITYTVTSVTSGGVRISLGGTTVGGRVRTKPGTYTDTFQSGNLSWVALSAVNTGATFSVDNVSVRETTPVWVASTSKRLSLWGDSMTSAAAGYADELGMEFPYLPIYDGGAGGNSSTVIKDRMIAASDKYGDEIIIQAGRNNFASPETVKADIAAMVAARTSDRYLVVSIFNGTTELVGSEGYTQIMQLNSDLAALYPNNYIDLRTYMVSQYNPAIAQDVIDYSNDVTPTSLRSDYLHINQSGCAIEAAYIGAWLRARGWHSGSEISITSSGLLNTRTGDNSTTAPSIITVTTPAIPASGPWAAEIKFRSKLNSNQITTPMAIWGSYNDANNYVQVLLDSTTLTLRKRVAGTNYDATMPMTVVANQNYSVVARINSDYSTDIFANGTKGTGYANTTQPVTSTNGSYQILSDGNGANQMYGSILAADLKTQNVSDTDALKATRYWYSDNGDLTISAPGAVINNNIVIGTIYANEDVTINNTTANDIVIATGKTVTGSHNFFSVAAKSGDGTYLGTATSWNADPLFVSSSDFNIQSVSPAIDSGTSAALTTDYAGNPIYGTPDIGAYEYQPPYTFAANNIPTTGSTRLYSDGKYRMTTASSTSDIATFSVAPSGGFYTASTSAYMDITVNTWTTANKEWIATSTIGQFNTHATSTVYTIGDLVPNVAYTFKLDGTASTTAITDNSQCVSGVCTANGSGVVSFTYVGGYSTHTFDLTEVVADTTVTIIPTTSGSSINACGYGFVWNPSKITCDKTATIAPTALATTPSGLSAGQVQSILDVLASFNADAAVIESVRNALSGTSIIHSVTVPQSFSFTRNLSLYQTGAEVKALQQFLNTHGFIVASTGPGSAGNETTLFGRGTYLALMKFQKSQGLPVTGYFGPMTRAKVVGM